MLLKNLFQNNTTFYNTQVDKRTTNSSQEDIKTHQKMSYNIHDLLKAGLTSEQIHTYFDNVQHDTGKTFGAVKNNQKGGIEETPYYTLKEGIVINGKSINSIEDLGAALKLDNTLKWASIMQTK